MLEKAVESHPLGPKDLSKNVVRYGECRYFDASKLRFSYNAMPLAPSISS